MMTKVNFIAGRVKRMRIAAALMVVALFASCAETTDEGPVVNPDASESPISFSSYLESNSPSTRVFTGSINSRSRLRAAGFGVFAYYTGSHNYTSDRLPDFFYNQQVIWQSADNANDSDGSDGVDAGWTYSPLKFWPNETGPASGGISNRKASFFAYAPFETIDLNANDISNADNLLFYTTADTVGITSISSNANAGDPIIGYKSALDSAEQSVDLLWGVASDGSNYRNAAGDSVILPEGMPLLNLTRQRDGDAVSFHFKHSLCRLGVNVTGNFEGIKAPIDPTNGTIVLVKSVVITGNFPARGYLNLNNTTASVPLWTDCQYDIGDTVSTIIVDHRSITRSLRDVDYKDAATDLWNHNCQQGGVYSTTRYLLKSFSGDDDATGMASRAYFMLIPNSPAQNTHVRVTVDYTIQTIDKSLKLTGGYSRQEHVVTAEGDLPGMEAGRTYTLNLNLSLSGMTFNVDTEEWR